MEIPAAQPSDTATIVVRVPADAKVYFDDTLTEKSGSERSFVTPGLQPGQIFFYTIKAEVTRDGKALTQSQRVNVQAGQTTEVDFSSLGEIGAAQPDEAPGDAGWPRKFDSDGNTVTIYQPQVEKWEKNRLEARAAVSIETKASPQPRYGVLQISARTEVDKEARMVTLDNFRIVKIDFPAAADRSDDYAAMVRNVIPENTTLHVSLDRLEGDLAVSRAETRPRKGRLKNDPPRVFYSTTPAILVLIDGKPALRRLSGTNYLRVINTRGLLLLDEATGTYYLHLADNWVSGKTAEGERTLVKDPPATLGAALQQVRDQNLPVDLLDNPDPDVKAELDDGRLPTVFVSAVPAELVVTQGEPQMAPIEGTQLLYVKNTSAQLLMDVASQQYYVLLSGRWFRSKDLARGSWEFVPGDKLPADFARVPDNHPKGDILASVAGTPQAHESVIANSLPQTARINRKKASLTVNYDGDPKFEPVEDTKLQYAVNSPTPVVQVEPNSYYACENGVWFSSATPTGPWSAAAAVPDAIYDIPPSNPLNYVTNTYIYDSTPDYVDVGYTPGYFGTYVVPWGGVVWGTGWAYRPWIGNWWYGRAWSYGWGARFGWTAGGWGLSFSAWHARPWWGPAGWNARWSGGAWHAGWNAGYGGRYNNVHFNQVNFNNFNAYNRWNSNVRIRNTTNVNINQANISRTNINRASLDRANLGATNVRNNLVINNANNIRNNLGVNTGAANNVFAGRDGNVYRRAEGNWQQHTGTGWQQFRPGATGPQINNLQQLNNAASARRAAQTSSYNFHGAGGFAGQNGGFGGYHGVSGFHGGGGAVRAAGGFHGRR
jgi:uncharacterized protein (TIGR03000 family)